MKKWQFPWLQKCFWWHCAICSWRALFILLEASTTSTMKRTTAAAWWLRQYRGGAATALNEHDYVLAPHRTGSTFYFSKTLGIVRSGWITTLWPDFAAVCIVKCGTWKPSEPRMGHFWPMLWPFLVDNKSGMSGGRCPPYEDACRTNTGQQQSTLSQRQNHDFRIPAAAAAANWLRTTYQIDNNAAGKDFNLS